MRRRRGAGGGRIAGNAERGWRGVAEQVDVAEVRREIAERGQGFVSEATGFDVGDEFTSEDQVRVYFQVANIRAMLGECRYSQEALDLMAEAVVEHAWHMGPPSEPTYEVIRYAADGHVGERDPGDPWMSDGAVLCIGTLDECREAIAQRLGEAATLCPECWGSTVRGQQGPRWDADRERWMVYRGGWVPCPACAGTGLALGWSGLGASDTPDGVADVEAYHESWADGCGGWAIRRAAPTA